MLRRLIIMNFVLASSVFAGDGPYISSPIYKNSTSFVGWATGATIVRGFANIAEPMYAGEPNMVSYGSPQDALGKAEGEIESGVVSLGDGGIATLTFDNPITNGQGNDFAVFENSFDGLFLELAFVQVSSDGNNFFEFECVSLTPTNRQVVQTGGMGELDTTNIHNLAGKYEKGFGTGFDLEELKNVSELLDVNSITCVRIIDVVGFVEPADFYGDGIVDFKDFSIFAAAYGSKNNDDNWNEDCDIYQEWIPPDPEIQGDIGYYDDPDGLIDIYDLQILATKWLVENNYSNSDINCHQINDPWPTPFHTGGFDLDAVGVINEKTN